MKNRMVSMIVTAALMFGTAAALSVTAQEASQSVTLSFKAGDNILNINGKAVEVEPPFIAGEGITLVPLRVITEAFGVQVEWTGETQTVKLIYRDSFITLQIGNHTAVVNDQEKNLEEAPVLTGSGVTMVPLRFISETFGALVSYDNDTGTITVKKPAESGQDTQVPAVVYDSKYKWTMKLSENMQLAERDNGGFYTIWKDDNDNKVEVSVIPCKDKKSYQKFLENLKREYADASLLSEHKGADPTGNAICTLSWNNGVSRIEDKTIYSDGFIMEARAVMSVGETEDKKREIQKMVENFNKTEGKPSSAVDLCTMKDGMYEYTNSNYKIKLNVPEFLYLDRDREQKNEMVFLPVSSQYKEYGMRFDLYAKTEGVTAERCAEINRDHEAALYNPDIVNVSKVSKEEKNGISIYFYTISLEGSEHEDAVIRIEYMETDSHIYCAKFSSPRNYDKKIVDKMSAYEFVPFEEGEADVPKWTDADIGQKEVKRIETDDSKYEYLDIELTNRWEMEQTRQRITLKSRDSQSYTELTYKIKGDFSKIGIDKRAIEWGDGIVDTPDYDVEIIQNDGIKPLNGEDRDLIISKNLNMEIRKIVVKVQNKEHTRTDYNTHYICVDDNKNNVLITLVQNELFYGGIETKECDEMVRTMKFSKK